MRALIALLLLAGCEQATPVADTPGAQLERAAIARGLVADPQAATLVGRWGSDTDRLCIVPAGEGFRAGAAVDYGDGQACAARGSARRQGGGLRFDFGDCGFDATFDGERIAFPATLPSACERLCAGRASLAALTAERMSQSVSEAAALRGANGTLLCGG